jgi:predicted nuclease of restriction endonuclease-like RecB superfamily
MKTVPFRQERDRLVLQLLDERDTPWIAALVDELEQAVGRPWRELLERIERLPERSSSARRAAVLQAVRGILGGRVGGPVNPKLVRRSLFAAAAIGDGVRDARIAAVAQALKTTSEDLMLNLWRDLPAERAVVLPDGRPAELAIAADANLRIIQRALLRCYELRLEVSGNARSIVRTAAVRGLLAVARRQGDRVALHVSGPLALFHRTTVYGRAMGSLVPHLAWCEQFSLEARCDLGQGPATFRLQPPLLLPPSSRPERHDSALEARFERDMARRASEWRVLREPSAVDAGAHLIFPDFQLEHRMATDRRWWVEIVGYWTTDYLAHKLASYRAANLPRVILCINAKRSLAEHELPRDARIVRFKKHVPVEQILAIVEAAH